MQQASPRSSCEPTSARAFDTPEKTPRELPTLHPPSLLPTPTTAAARSLAATLARAVRPAMRGLAPTRSGGAPPTPRPHAPLTRAVAASRGLASLWSQRQEGAVCGVRGVTASAAPAEVSPTAAATQPNNTHTPTGNVIAILRERGLLNDVAGDVEELERVACEVSKREKVKGGNKGRRTP